jgi:hypothetical protein
VAAIFRELVYKSLEEGEIPEDWKRAKVVPIFKKGDKSEANNYGPVSLNLSGVRAS